MAGKKRRRPPGLSLRETVEWHLSFAYKVRHPRSWTKTKCWQTDTCAAGSNGYPVCTHEGRTYGLHRLALARKLGREIRPGMMALHKCDNPVCIRPSHLYEGTDLDNARDREQRTVRDLAVGERHGLSKLTEDDVREIRRLREEDGMFYHDIAARFGMQRHAITCICQGKTWRHVH